MEGAKKTLQKSFHTFTCGQKGGGRRQRHTLTIPKYTPAHAYTFFHSKIKWSRRNIHDLWFVEMEKIREET